MKKTVMMNFIYHDRYSIVLFFISFVFSSLFTGRVEMLCEIIKPDIQPSLFAPSQQHIIQEKEGNLPSPSLSF